LALKSCALDVVLLGPGLVHHRHVLQLLGQHGIGRFELDLQRQRVDLADGRHTLELEGALRRRFARTLQREHGVIRSEGCAIVELDARAQLEAPRGGRAHLPRQGQCGFELVAFIATDQRLVDLEVDARVVQQRHRMRVQRLRVKGRGHTQRGAR
jgi:hypothetical protein